MKVRMNKAYNVSSISSLGLCGSLKLPCYGIHGKTEMRTRTLASKSKKNKDVDNILHKEFMKFQEKIEVKQSGSVDGSKQLEIANLILARGGKNMKNKYMKKIDQMNDNQVGGGNYPQLRYSQEETERLLKEAYEGIPKREGKRGTRKKRRGKRRQNLVRKIHHKVKVAKVKAHYKKMEKRSRIAREVRETNYTSNEIQLKEEAYQMIVLKGWAEKVFSRKKDDATILNK